MASKGNRRRPAKRQSPDRRLLAALFVGAVAILVVGLLWWQRPPVGATPWVRLGTADVHSLSFAGSTERLLFGHHGGVLESTDGGRSWGALGARADAMSLVVDEHSIVIAGHFVFQESTDGGRTWRDIPADLPNLDIHAFTRSTSDPSRMWAYLAEGGVYESTDGGRRWTKVHDDHVVNLTYVDERGRERLLGVQPFVGLVLSEDGGRSWTHIAEPPVVPVTVVAAAGASVLVGGPAGLYRSDDAGASWRPILEVGTILAAAISADGQVVAAVNRDTEFYRSDDGGRTWPAP